MKFQFYFTIFIVGFILGIIYNFVFDPPHKIYVKYPTPLNSEKTVFTNSNNECYKVKSEQIKCKGNEYINEYIKEF